MDTVHPNSSEPLISEDVVVTCGNLLQHRDIVAQVNLVSLLGGSSHIFPRPDGTPLQGTTLSSIQSPDSLNITSYTIENALSRCTTYITSQIDNIYASFQQKQRDNNNQPTIQQQYTILAPSVLLVGIVYDEAEYFLHRLNHIVEQLVSPLIHDNDIGQYITTSPIQQVSEILSSDTFTILQQTTSYGPVGCVALIEPHILRQIAPELLDIVHITTTATTSNNNNGNNNNTTLYNGSFDLICLSQPFLNIANPSFKTSDIIPVLSSVLKPSGSLLLSGLSLSSSSSSVSSSSNEPNDQQHLYKLIRQSQTLPSFESLFDIFTSSYNIPSSPSSLFSLFHKTISDYTDFSSLYKQIIHIQDAYDSSSHIIYPSNRPQYNSDIESLRHRLPYILSPVLDYIATTTQKDTISSSIIQNATHLLEISSDTERTILTDDEFSLLCRDFLPYLSLYNIVHSDIFISLLQHDINDSILQPYYVVLTRHESMHLRNTNTTTTTTTTTTTDNTANIVSSHQYKQNTPVYVENDDDMQILFPSLLHHAIVPSSISNIQDEQQQQQIIQNVIQGDNDNNAPLTVYDSMDSNNNTTLDTSLHLHIPTSNQPSSLNHTLPQSQLPYSRLRRRDSKTNLSSLQVRSPSPYFYYYSLEEQPSATGTGFNTPRDSACTTPTHNQQQQQLHTPLLSASPSMRGTSHNRLHRNTSYTSLRLNRASSMSSTNSGLLSGLLTPTQSTDDLGNVQQHQRGLPSPLTLLPLPSSSSSSHDIPPLSSQSPASASTATTSIPSLALPLPPYPAEELTAAEHIARTFASQQRDIVLDPTLLSSCAPHFAPEITTIKQPLPLSPVQNEIEQSCDEIVNNEQSSSSSALALSLPVSDKIDIPGLPSTTTSSLESTTIEKPLYDTRIIIEPRTRICISGISVGLPNSINPEDKIHIQQLKENNPELSQILTDEYIYTPSEIQRRVFQHDNIDQIMNGVSFLSTLTTKELNSILSMHPFELGKDPQTGKRIKKVYTKHDELIHVHSKIGQFNLHTEYGVPLFVIEALDLTFQLAIAAGLEALLDAGFPVIQRTIDHDTGKSIVQISPLPPPLRDQTGVIFASSFPGADSLIEEAMAAGASHARHELMTMLSEYKQQHNLINDGQSSSSSSTASTSTSPPISTTTQSPPQLLPRESLRTVNDILSHLQSYPHYEYNRKLVFRILVMANSQLAELIRATGPNTHCNAACAGTSQAIAIADDWLRHSKRCSRVVVVASDTATSDNLLPYISTGFMVLGAASKKSEIYDAACPFDKRRKGMIVGAGAVGLVLETVHAMNQRRYGRVFIDTTYPIHPQFTLPDHCPEPERIQDKLKCNINPWPEWVPLSTWKPKAELLLTHIANSAFHASLIHTKHITQEMNTIMTTLELLYGHRLRTQIQRKYNKLHNDNDSTTDDAHTSSSSDDISSHPTSSSLLHDNDNDVATTVKNIDSNNNPILSCDTMSFRQLVSHELLYFSHETGTASCAKVEIAALHAYFDHYLKNVTICNTKGYSGHAMGVAIEDVIAVASLDQGKVPPIANHSELDPAFNNELCQITPATRKNNNLEHDRFLSFRFAAGFGSQLVMIIYAKWDDVYKAEYDLVSIRDSQYRDQQWDAFNTMLVAQWITLLKQHKQHQISNKSSSHRNKSSIFSNIYTAPLLRYLSQVFVQYTSILAPQPASNTHHSTNSGSTTGHNSLMSKPPLPPPTPRSVGGPSGVIFSSQQTSSSSRRPQSNASPLITAQPIITPQRQQSNHISQDVSLSRWATQQYTQQQLLQNSILDQQGIFLQQQQPYSHASQSSNYGLPPPSQFESQLSQPEHPTEQRN